MSECVTDTVLETYHDRESDVKVEKVKRHGYKEDRILLRVYGKRKHDHMTFDGIIEETENWKMVGEIPAKNLHEVFKGLSEVYESE